MNGRIWGNFRRSGAGGAWRSLAENGGEWRRLALRQRSLLSQIVSEKIGELGATILV